MNTAHAAYARRLDSLLDERSPMTYAKLGINYTQASRWQKLAKIEEEMNAPGCIKSGKCYVENIGGKVMAECSHEYVHLDTDLKMESGNYGSVYTRIDRFFCNKCLHEVEKTKTEESRNGPVWWHNRQKDSREES